MISGSSNRLFRVGFIVPTVVEAALLIAIWMAFHLLGGVDVSILANSFASSS